jgi:hypothetical protein
MKGFVGFCFAVFVGTLCPAPAPSAAQPDARAVYAGLPVEVQLLIADIKLDALIKEAGEAGGGAKARTLGEAKASLKEAIRKYEFFRTGDKAVLAPDWGFSWAPPRPDYPSVTKSPLSVLEHLWIGYDMAVQTRAGIMVAPVRYSAAEAERHASLDGAVEMMRKAVEAVEASGVWIVHWLSDARVMISAPPEFKPASLMKDDVVRLVKPKPDGSDRALAFVSRTLPARDETEIGPERYRERRIEKLRGRFPDLSVVEMGESRRGDGEFTTSFSYRYTWEGAPIMALVRIRLAMGSVYEVSCVAAEGDFDRAEADRIVGSFLLR